VLGESRGTQVKLTSANETDVFISFGADSKLLPAAIPACNVKDGLVCQFKVKGTTTLPNPGGLYLNATVAFGKAVGCGSTKAELNVNNPTWFDVLDVSLVDGYSNNLSIDYLPHGGGRITITPNGTGNNADVGGVYPLGCDVCVARQNPPCGMTPGTDGCKKGTQYKPDVPCQFQGAIKGGGGVVEVYLPAGGPFLTPKP
jgi:hypothetical protein